MSALFPWLSACSNLLTAAGFGFVLFDGRRRITLCSRHFAANLGFADSEDAVGTPLEDIMGPESLEDLETLLVSGYSDCNSDMPGIALTECCTE